ncbi:hypothetical protein ACWEVO_35965, partial [Micromonospora sp. NPDC003776]
MVDHEVDTPAGTAVVDADAVDRRGAVAVSSDGVLARVRAGAGELTGALRRGGGGGRAGPAGGGGGAAGGG